jgi:dolichyldiphosphatase
MHSLLTRINDSTKWIVSAIAFAYLLFNRDLLSCWCIFGAVAASIVNKIVKHTLNHQRPHTSKKSDPGMPSAHANSLAYLSTFCALASSSQPLSEPLGLLLVFGVPSIAIYLAWLRVILGYHTIPQVAVGWVVGSGVASGWWLLGSRRVIPYLVATAVTDPVYSSLLYGLTVAAVAGFSYTNVKRWWFEDKNGVAVKYTSKDS